mmetsp:Transcript_6317/g.16146  ORF Transcript_6317/g.16146 Transcript_6317/m.16146 type:complete len:114 (-) Transcript_6317:613-954(-)
MANGLGWPAWVLRCVMHSPGGPHAAGHPSPMWSQPSVISGQRTQKVAREQGVLCLCQRRERWAMGIVICALLLSTTCAPSRTLVTPPGVARARRNRPAAAGRAVSELRKRGEV